MAKKGMTIGDIIQADTSDKINLAAGVMSWAGLFFIGRGLRKLLLKRRYDKLVDKVDKEGGINYTINDW